MRKKEVVLPNTPIFSPPRSDEERDMQMTNLAYDLVEKRMREGTASSAETVHFLKLGSQKERLELDQLREQVKLLKARTEDIERGKKNEELYSKAIAAMREYSGNGSASEDGEW